MKDSLVAERYARALFEICEENSCIDLAVEDMKRIRTILDGAPEVRQYCLRSKRMPAEENEFVKIAFLPYVSDFTKHLLLTLVKNGRLFSLPFIPDAFENIFDESRNVVTIHVESVHRLSDSEISGIKRQMESRIGKSIKVVTAIVSDLLGGFRIMWQNRILDFTLKGRLQQLRRLMSDEIH